MLRRATWRSWALPGVLLAVFIVLGLTWNPSGDQADWIYKVGTLGATVAPLVLTGIYAATGNRFWANDLGTALVQSLLSIVVIAAPLCWAIWLDHGSITGGMVAWLEVAGPLLATMTILRLCYVFLRYHRDSNGGGSHEKGALSMFAWLAAALFFVAFLISGGDLSPATAWLHPVTLIAAGLTLAMLHAADGPPWRRGG